MRETRQFRGISKRAALQYLRTLGGEPVDGDLTGDDREDVERLEGDGWSAEVSAERIDVVGSISLTEVTVVFEGTGAAVEPIVEQFARKAMRAGG